MRTPEQIASHVSYWTKTPASEVGLKVAALLEEWDGLHHFEDSLMSKVEWSHPYCIQIKARNGRLATFDFDGLTALVFLAHDHCIRVDIVPCNSQFLKIMFHPRKSREGGMSQRHPTIDKAVERWREGHSCRFEVEDEVLADHGCDPSGAKTPTF